jgi:hypothetical protein
MFSGLIYMMMVLLTSANHVNDRTFAGRSGFLSVTAASWGLLAVLTGRVQVMWNGDRWESLLTLTLMLYRLSKRCSRYR